MNHYYTNNTDLKSDETIIQFRYKNKNVLLKSDYGVFSKEKVDYGSRVLLDNVLLNEQQKKLLDVGCGYGTLGVSLKIDNPWLRVDMVDVSERAVHLSNESIQLNHLSNIKAYQSNIYENVNDTFDVIVTNPPIRAGKKVVLEILEKSYIFLNEDGIIYVVIQKKQGAPSAKKKLEEIFENCEIVKRDKGYYVLKSRKLKK